MMAGRPCGRIALLSFVAIAGICGMLFANSAWAGLFFVLAALPVFLGSVAVVRHRRTDGKREP